MPVHQSGDPFVPSARTQNKIEDLVNANDVGARRTLPRPIPQRPVPIRAKNNSGANVDRYAVVQIGSDTDLVDPHETKQGKRDPSITLVATSWPDVFGSFAITLEPIPDGKYGVVCIFGLTVATVDIVKTTDRFAAVSKSDPTRLRSSDTGEVRLLAEQPATGVRQCQVFLMQPPVVEWRYKWESSPYSDYGELVRMDGDDFDTDARVELLDPLFLMDDQVAGDEGLLHQIANKFYPYQGPCG